jgi:hypothetical protein
MSLTRFVFQARPLQHLSALESPSCSRPGEDYCARRCCRVYFLRTRCDSADSTSSLSSSVRIVSDLARWRDHLPRSARARSHLINLARERAAGEVCHPSPEIGRQIGVTRERLATGGRSKTDTSSYIRMSGPPTASAQPLRPNRQASCAQARFSSVAIHPTKVRMRSG